MVDSPDILYLETGYHETRRSESGQVLVWSPVLRNSDVS